MNILVLCESYPSEANLYAMNFVHSRLVEYVALGHTVSVLSFSTRVEYTFGGIRVRPAHGFGEVASYDVIVSHAPNLRHHLRFLAEHPHLPVVFVLHGHEVLLTARYYPRPFAFDQRWTQPLERSVRAVYDRVKLAAFSSFIALSRKRGRSMRFVFVSEWMRREALRYMRIAPEWMEARSAIIPNPVNRVFLERSYRRAVRPRADFVCIRPFDNPKYAVDVVLAWALHNPTRHFHLYGKGRYFQFHEPPGNVEVIPEYVPQGRIPELLDEYTAAVMPTRLDAQGVMVCEMASYGIPVITSDLDVTREVLGGFPNVAWIPNDRPPLLERIPPPLEAENSLRLRFSTESTVREELALLEGSVLSRDPVRPCSATNREPRC